MSFFVSILVVENIGGALNTPHIGERKGESTDKSGRKSKNWSVAPGGDIISQSRATHS
jgi:hypothetical protein